VGGAEPFYQERFAHAAFVGPAFAGAQGQVGCGRTHGGGEAAVVRGEKDDGVFVEFQLGEFVEEAADIFIEVLDHRSVGRVVLNLPHGAAVIIEEFGAFACGQLGGFGFVFFEQSGLGLERVVDGIVREVDEERLVAVLLDEADRLAGETVGEVFPVRSVGQVRELIRAEVGWRSPLAAAAEVEVEALVLGPMLGSVAEVPFSEESRFVAAGLQRLGDGDFFQRQEGLDFQAPEPLFRLVLASGQPIRDAQAGRRFASQDAGTGGGADRRSSVGIGEAHAFLRQSVEVWRLVKSAPIAAEVRPAEVVGDYENDV